MRPIVFALRLLAGGYMAALLALSVIHLAAPQGNGVLAVTQIFAPFLFLPLLPLLPLLVRSGTPLRLLMLACTMVYLLRLAPAVALWTPAPSDNSITALSWNVQYTNTRTDAVRHVLLNADVDVVVLQELAPRHAAAIDGDPQLHARYPYQVLAAQPDSTGMGILSAYPLREHRIYHAPPVLVAQVDIGAAEPLVIVNAHPMLSNPRPSHFVAADRDAQIERIRELTASFIQDGRPLLLLGDFNVTEREPAYRLLSDGLLDAHLEAGNGYGATWRPDARSAFGVLRIDYMLASPSLPATTLRVDCTPRGSDHCVLRGSFTIVSSV